MGKIYTTFAPLQVYSEELTATKLDILRGKTAGTSDSDDEPIVGAMENLAGNASIKLTSTDARPVIDGNESWRGVTNTDGVRRVCIQSGKRGFVTENTIFAVPAQTKTVMPSASSQTVLPDSGNLLESVTVNAISNLSAANIKHGVTVGGVTGNFTADAVLDPQYLMTGYSGYDDGVKKNGTMLNISASTSTTLTTSDSRKVRHQTNTSDAYWVVTNSDNVLRACIKVPAAGYYTTSNIIGVAAGSMASAGGLTAAKLMKNQSAFGIAGTATSDANAAAGNILSGYSGYVNGQKIHGTIPIIGGQTITPKSYTQTVSCSGKYMTGNITVTGTNLYKSVHKLVTIASSSEQKKFKDVNNVYRNRYYIEINDSSFKKITTITACCTSSGDKNHALWMNDTGIVFSSYSGGVIQFDISVIKNSDISFYVPAGVAGTYELSYCGYSA